MKQIIVIVLLGLYCQISISQNNKTPTNDFDFWIGQWNTNASVPPNWVVQPGIDSVRYQLNHTLIEEIFTKGGGSEMNFQRSYLFFLKREGRWQHTIYDSKWGEYSFYGNREGENMVLYSDSKSSRPGLRRETFYNVRENEFDYKWETSKDGGMTWIVIWKVNYKRQIK